MLIRGQIIDQKSGKPELGQSKSCINYKIQLKMHFKTRSHLFFGPNFSIFVLKKSVFISILKLNLIILNKCEYTIFLYYHLIQN